MKTWTIQDVTSDKDLNRVWSDISNIEAFKGLTTLRINLLIGSELKDCIVLSKEALKDTVCILEDDTPSTPETIIIADDFDYFMNVEELNGLNFDDSVLEDILKSHFEREVLLEQYHYYCKLYFSPSKRVYDKDRETTANTIQKLRKLLNKKDLKRYKLETGNKIGDAIYLDCDLEKEELEGYIERVRDILEKEAGYYYGYTDFEILIELFKNDNVPYNEVELISVSL